MSKKDQSDEKPDQDQGKRAADRGNVPETPRGATNDEQSDADADVETSERIKRVSTTDEEREIKPSKGRSSER